MRNTKKEKPHSPQRPKEPRRAPNRPNSSEHYQQLLTLLKSEDPMDVLQGVSQLSSELVMAQDDVLSSFPLDLMTPPLVECLQRDGIEDISLYALNCLNQLADAVPNVCNIIVATGGIPVLCTKLMNLSYIDVSEQAIKLLDRLSYEHAAVILQEGGFSALLNVLDFFEMAVQRTVLGILVSVSRTVPSEELYQREVVPTLPVLASLLLYRSQEAVAINEAALDFFIGLVESLERLAKGASEQLVADLDLIHSQGVVRNAMELAQTEKSLLPPFFRLLKVLSRGSANVLIEWLHMGGSQMLSQALTVAEGEGDPAMGEYLLDALQLLESAFPSVSDSKHPVSDSARDAVLNAHPDLLTYLGRMVIPRLFPLYDRFVNKSIKQLSLDILEKLVAREELLPDLSPKLLADFISELLTSRDINIVRKALKIAILLYRKVPDQVSRFFAREGVIYRVEQLRDPKTKREWVLTGPVVREPRSRLRHMLEGMQGGLDSRNLDQFLMFLRRRERATADSDPPLPDRLKRYMSDPQTDPLEVAKAEMDKLGFEVLLFHQRFGKEAYGQVLNELKIVSNYFFSTTSDNPEPHLSTLLRLMSNGDTVSAYELESSKVVDGLWRWLTCAQDLEEFHAKKLQTVLIRARELLKCVFRDNGNGDTSYPALVSLLEAMVKCNQQLPVTLYETAAGSSTIAGLRTLSTRVAVQLIYTPEPLNAELSPEERDDLEAINALFTQAGPLCITLEQYHSFDTISDILSKVRCVEDLEVFRNSFYRSASEIRGINQGQLNLIRQHLRLQQMMSENFDLATSLGELGVRLEGNEELLSELQEQLRPGEEEETASPSEEVEIAAVRKQSMALSASFKAVLAVSGVEIEPHCTLFHAFSRYQDHPSDDPLPVTFKYIKNEQVTRREEARFLQGSSIILWSLLKEASQVGVDSNDPLHPPLRLLKFLHSLNRLLPALFSKSSFLFANSEEAVGTIKYPLPASAFQCAKLTALLGKQTQDVLATVGHTASQWVWRLPRSCPFLFSFPTRLDLLKSSAVNPTKGLQFYSNRVKMTGEQFNIRLPRHKVRVSRDHILDSALRVMNDKTLLQLGTLEFDYVDEEGTGAGPTLEFYSLTAREVRGLKVWRSTGEDCGLFPSPVVGEDTEEMFEFLGRFIGKAIADEKVLDLPLSPAFWKLVFSQALTLSDLTYVDKSLHRYLSDLHEVVARRHWIQTNPNFSPEARERQLSQLTYKGTPISNLTLNFTLPGYDLELKPQGKDEFVTLDTLESYIQLVAETTLMQTTQAAAFRKGLEVLVPAESLSGFTGEELETLVCGEAASVWDLDMLQEAVVPAHGYTKSSAVYQNLLLVMTQLSAQDQKTFLQFVTGAPRLPMGGFKVLNPPLTVVRKDTNGPSDSFLPSVMT